MHNQNEHVRKLIDRLEKHPVVRAIRQRSDFEAVVLVQTNQSVDFFEAKTYTFSQMQGRVRPERTREGYNWFFELDEDAIQFIGKFNYILAKRIPPADA